MSMSMRISPDNGRDEEDDDLDLDDDDDDDGEESGGRNSRSSDRRNGKGKRESSKDDEDDDEDDDDADEGKSEDELRAELKRLRKAVSTAGKQTARQRERVKEQRARIRSLEGKVDDDGGDDADEDDDEGEQKPREKGLDAKALQKRIDRAKRETRRQLEEEHRQDLINTRAEAAFARAGVSEKNARLLLREIDYDEIDFDPKSRSIEGLDDEIDRLKGDFPDLFRRKRAGRRINGGDEREERRGRKPQTATEKQVAALQGR